MKIKEIFIMKNPVFRIVKVSFRIYLDFPVTIGSSKKISLKYNKKRSWKKWQLEKQEKEL